MPSSDGLLEALVEQLLDLSRLEGGVVTSERREIGLRTTAEHTARTVTTAGTGPPVGVARSADTLFAEVDEGRRATTTRRRVARAASWWSADLSLARIVVTHLLSRREASLAVRAVRSRDRAPFTTAPRGTARD